MRQEAHGRRFPVRSRDGDDGDIGLGDDRRLPRLDRLEPMRRLSDRARQIPARRESGTHQLDDLGSERFGRTTPAPREGHDDLLPLRTRPGPDRQPGATLVRQLPGEVCREPGHEPKALLAAWRAGTERVTGLLRCRDRPVLGRFDPSRDGDGELHGRFREVEVRPVEDPKLHQAHGLGACHGEGLYRWRDSLRSR